MSLCSSNGLCNLIVVGRGATGGGGESYFPLPRVEQCFGRTNGSKEKRNRCEFVGILP